MRVGVLGGGQLARMLIQQGQKMGLEMYVLCPKADDPAAQVTRNWVDGNPHQEADIVRFMKELDVVTFESEFMNGSLLARLQKQTNCRIEPKPELIDLLQDRLTQKNWLMKHRIPTAPFVSVNCFDDLKQATHKFSKGLVLKKRRFGYDGYGTYILNPKDSLEPYHELFAQSHDGFIAEAKVSFKRELATLVGRSTHGDFAALPLVESHQKNQRCFWVKGPVKHKEYLPLLRKIKSLLKEEEYIGVIAFELFDCQNELWVNEIAPRVHNSAHYSLDALSIDQFSLHLKCITGMKIANPELRQGGFAMLNLLGEGTGTPHWDLSPHLSLHWYGKSENRPGRKLGHLNSLAKKPNQALKAVLKAQKDFSL